MLGLTSPSLLSPSPEKEAFKKRQKLQQDNGEETDENEVEEVSSLCAHPEEGAWVSLSMWEKDQDQPGPASRLEGLWSQE